MMMTLVLVLSGMGWRADPAGAAAFAELARSSLRSPGADPRDWNSTWKPQE